MASNPRTFGKASTEVSNGLLTLNQVHSVATLLWTEKVTQPTQQQSNRYKNKSKNSNQPKVQQRRITPVQLTESIRNNADGINRIIFSASQRQPNPASNKHVLSPSRQFDPQEKSKFRKNGKASATAGAFDKGEHKKKIQIKSLPRKPPDISSFDAFPPVNASVEQISLLGAKNVDRSNQKSNPFASSIEESKFDPNYERKQMFKEVQKVQDQIVSSPKHNVAQHAVEVPDIVLGRKNSVSSEDGRDATRGRSEILFSTISEKELEELSVLSSNYSQSIDNNLCRSILGELTFLCQLLVANNDGTESSFSNVQQLKSSTVLTSLAPRTWFVKSIFEKQLELMCHLSSDVLQLLVDFYPHRIPKSLRKKFEQSIQRQLEIAKEVQHNETQKSPFENSSSPVIFQSETDSRINFPHQKNSHDFGKQRDLFYAVRENWMSQQCFLRENDQLEISHGKTSSPVGIDRARSKIHQIFQLNSSSPNLSKLASLMLSQCFLDINFANRQGSYDSTCMDNIRRILETNPSKYEKLRQRISSSGCDFGDNQRAIDPIEFLKYFINTSNSPGFVQHMIDHTIFEIEKLEAEANDPCSFSERINQTRLIHLLGQIFGFLYFFPYRDEEVKIEKSTNNPVNTEIYIRTQIEFRKYQIPPLNLTEILVNALKEKRLTFTLPWIIEVLCQADQVTFQLQSYKSILELISAIYREVLVDENPYHTLSFENRTLLRFICGKLFGKLIFPDSFLFGNDKRNLAEIISVTDLNYITRKNPLLDEDNCTILDAHIPIGSTFLPVWFRSEIKQMISILSVNARVRGSQPSDNPGLVKHIPAIPETGASISPSTNSYGDSIGNQLSLETHFFQLHPSSVKKTVDFVSERLSANFIKYLRHQRISELKNDFGERGLHGIEAVQRFTEIISEEIEKSCKEQCEQAMSILLESQTSPLVFEMCKKICLRNLFRKILDWISHHVTTGSFPEICVPGSDLKQAIHHQEQNTSETLKNTASNKKTSFFVVLTTFHQLIQKLYNGEKIEDTLIDIVLEDDRLANQKVWIVHRTVDLIVSIITFSPATLTIERLEKFINFWKNIWSSSFNSFLKPKNCIIYSTSSNPQLTFLKLSILLKKLLKENLVNSKELEDDCLMLLREDWPSSTKILISDLLKNLVAEIEYSEEKEVIDWISWYCSGVDEEIN